MVKSFTLGCHLFSVIFHSLPSASPFPYVSTVYLKHPPPSVTHRVNKWKPHEFNSQESCKRIKKKKKKKKKKKRVGEADEEGEEEVEEVVGEENEEGEGGGWGEEE